MNKNFKLVSEVINSTRQIFAENQITNPSSYRKFVEGVNLSTEEAVVSNNMVEEMNKAIDYSLAKLALESFKDSEGFTHAQIMSAKMIAPYATNPKEYAGRLNRLSDPVAVGNNVVSFSAEAMGLADTVSSDAVIKNINLSMESYDGQSLNNSVFYSIAYNLGAAKQDEFGETLFPTIAIDPVQSGININVQFAVHYKEFQRQITGKVDREKYERVPIIKSIYDPAVFGVNNLKLIPVYRENNNKDLFLHTEQYVDTSTGENINTAPLLFGKEVELLGISQTDEILSKGMMDNTDSLDRTLGLEKIYYSLSDGTNTEMFTFDARVFAYKDFVYSPQSHHKDLILSFNTKAIIVNISDTKTSKGSDSTLLNTLATKYSNYKVVLGVDISGSANTMDAITLVHGNGFNIIQITNGDGQQLPETDAAYTEIKTLFATAKLEGYTLEAYRTNSNVRTRGLPVGVDVYNHIYAVANRQGVTAITPVNNVQGVDNDAALLGSQIQFTGVYISMEAVKKLTTFASAMNQAFNNNTLGTFQTQGIGQYLVNPWFRDTTFDLSNIVDSVQSHHRDDDVREALRLRIRQEVLDMYTGSNYGAAFDVLRGSLGGKIGVIVATDPVIQTLLLKDSPIFDLGDKFEAKVVSTLNNMVKGKIYITFGVFGEDRNVTPNPLNFGNMIYAPTISYEVQRAASSINREIHSHPRFAHIIHLPVLSVFNVTDIQGAFTKIAVHTKTV